MIDNQLRFSRRCDSLLINNLEFRHNAWRHIHSEVFRLQRRIMFRIIGPSLHVVLASARSGTLKTCKLLAPEVDRAAKAFVQTDFGFPAQHRFRLRRISVKNLDIERPPRNCVPQNLAAEASHIAHFFRESPHCELLAGAKVEDLANARLWLREAGQVRVYVVLDVKQIALWRGIAELDDVAAQHLDDHAFNEKMCIVAAAVGIEGPERSYRELVRVPHIKHVFFCRVLAHRVRAVRRLRGIFPLRQWAIAERLGSGSEQKVFEVRHFAKTGFGKVHRAHQIRFQDLIRMIIAIRNRADGSQMEHNLRLHFAERILDGEMIAQVAKDHLHIMVGPENIAPGNIAL